MWYQNFSVELQKSYITLGRKDFQEFFKRCSVEIRFHFNKDGLGQKRIHLNWRFCKISQYRVRNLPEKQRHINNLQENRWKNRKGEVPRHHWRGLWMIIFHFVCCIRIEYKHQLVSRNLVERDISTNLDVESSFLSTLTNHTKKHPAAVKISIGIDIRYRLVTKN